MRDTELNTNNKKNAGKGNGNTVIDNHENASNYVSGDTVSSSSSHRFDQNNTKNNKKKK